MNALEIEQAEDDTMTVTLRGQSDDVFKVLTHGLPLSALKQLSDALGVELQRRKDEGDTR